MKMIQQSKSQLKLNRKSLAFKIILLMGACHEHQAYAGNLPDIGQAWRALYLPSLCTTSMFLNVIGTPMIVSSYRHHMKESIAELRESNASTEHSRDTAERQLASKEMEIEKYRCTTAEMEREINMLKDRCNG